MSDLTYKKPDGEWGIEGGSEAAFQALTENYTTCLNLMEQWEA